MKLDNNIKIKILGYVSIGIGSGSATTNGGTPGGHPPTAPSPTTFHGACNGQATPAEVYTTGCLTGLIPGKYKSNPINV